VIDGREIGQPPRAGLELAHEHRDALFFRGVFVVPTEIERARNPAHRFHVSRRLLTQVQRRECQTECGDAAEDVAKPARGDQCVSSRDERPMAEEQ